MGYAVYEDHDARNYGVVRWAGYGVPAICDLADCTTKINRGLDYKCDTIYAYDETAEVETEEEECGLFFCARHQEHSTHETAQPKPDTSEWISHILEDESWQAWRAQNPEFVARKGARR